MQERSCIFRRYKVLKWPHTFGYVFCFNDMNKLYFLMHRLVLEKSRATKQMNPFACMSTLRAKNLFLEHLILRGCLSNYLIWCLTTALSFRTTGKMAVSTSMDTKLTNILIITHILPANKFVILYSQFFVIVLLMFKLDVVWLLD